LTSLFQLLGITDRENDLSDSTSLDDNSWQTSISFPCMLLILL